MHVTGTYSVVAYCMKLFLQGVFAGQMEQFIEIAKSLGYESTYTYAVIIDAGPSGSKVLAYKFEVFDQPKLVEEYYEQSKPGLYWYAEDPEGGAETIAQLIKKAELFTPVEKRNTTPLIVRATPRLRLLPMYKAQQLLDAVTKAIAPLGYDVGLKGVKIMEDSDEKLFIWYAVNHLYNLMEGETMAVVDLGDDSTQITYKINESKINDFPIEDRHVIPAVKNITLYDHSYQKMGLLATRYEIFRAESGGDNTNELESVCVHPIVQRELWKYGHKEYFVSGAYRLPAMYRTTAYKRCHELVRRYALKTLGMQPPRLPKAGVAATRHFYEVAADAGIIDVMRGGNVTVAMYRSSAVRACSAGNVEQPWACVDLTIVVNLMRNVYRIKDNERISLFRKVNGHQISWALGLAYTTVMNRLASATATA